MVIRRTFALSIIISSLLITVAAADPTVNVTFPEKGGYIYWMEFKDAAGKMHVAPPKRAAGSGTAVDLAPASVAGKLAAGELKIYDPKTGNVAVKSLENLAGKKDLKLKSADFDRVRTVRIVLRPKDGKPDERVESAVVTLKDANSDEFTVLIDPSSEGVATFHDIAAGQESVTAAYDGRRMTTDMDIPADRDAPVFEDDIIISTKVRTVKATTGPANATGEEAEGKPAAGKPQPQAANLPSIIMGFVFLALVGFIGYVVMKARGASLEKSLKKLGVQLPSDDDAPIPAPTTSEPQVDPTICQFCGQRKDPATGSCACSLDAGRTAAVGGTPRLIGMQGPYAGRIFELMGGDTTVGRDAANTIPLTDDSTSSRRHARIDRQNGACTITDEGSSNGTFVNGSRIASPHTLQPGDEIQIGSTKFKYEC